MRRAYPTSFCFQEVIEIILGVFFTASKSQGWGAIKAFSHSKGAPRARR
jgi:hypothetical protein